jgi:hypothetical protein
VSVNTPVQSPEEYFSEHSDDLFDKEKGAKVMAEYTRRVTEREFGPMFNAQAQALVSTKKELLSAKDANFNKYEAEIEALVKSQSQAVQLQPDIYERAWLTVRQKHQVEIEEESVNSKVNAAVEAKLKELGIDLNKKPENARPAAYVNSEGRSTPNVASGKRTVRLPDEATKTKLENEAKRRGLDLNDLLRTKGYL